MEFSVAAYRFGHSIARPRYTVREFIDTRTGATVEVKSGYGLTTPDPAVSDVKSQAVRSARRRVFVGVHTKFGAVSFCRFAEVGDFESIVTDTGLPSAEAQRYSLLGPQDRKSVV